MKFTKKGFTLIELLVVVAIIGLLATLAMVSLSGTRGKARDAKRMADIAQIQTALELFSTETGSYPTASSAIDLGLTNYVQLCSPEGFTTQTGTCTTALMSVVPPGVSGGLGTNPTTFSFLSGATSPAVYRILFYLEGDPDAAGPRVAGAQCATPTGTRSVTDVLNCVAQ